MKKIFAWLLLLSALLGIGLGGWYLSRQEIPPAVDIIDESPALQNIYDLTERLAEIFNPEDFRPDTSDPNNLLIIVHNRLVFKFGQPVDLDKKYDALVTILGVVKDDLPKIQYIDVRAYRTPAVR